MRFMSLELVNQNMPDLSIESLLEATARRRPLGGAADHGAEREKPHFFKKPLVVFDDPCEDVSSRYLRSASSARRSILSLSLPAAFSVKVKAMMDAGSVPEVRRRTARRAKTSVFPEPAPAMIWRIGPLCSMAWSWAAVSVFGIGYKLKAAGSRRKREMSSSSSGSDSTRSALATARA